MNTDKLMPTSYYRPTVYIPFALEKAEEEVNFGSHIYRHVDEWVGVWLAIMFAGLDWVDKYARDGNVEMGIGRGRFDEHSGWVLKDGVWKYVRPKKNRCSATLVAKTLEFEGRPLDKDRHLKKLLKYVADDDLTADHRPDNWERAVGQVVKDLNYFLKGHPRGEEIVGRWVFQFMDAWMQCCRIGKPLKEFTIDEIKRRLKKVPAHSIPDKARDRWEWHGWGEWLEIAENAIAAREREFAEATKIVADLPKDHVYETDRYDKGKKVRMAFVESSNRKIGSATRAAGFGYDPFDVCMQFCPDGDLQDAMQVFVSEYRQSGSGPVSPRSFTYHMRRREARLMGSLLPDEIREQIEAMADEREPWLIKDFETPFSRIYSFQADDRYAKKRSEEKRRKKKKTRPEKSVFLGGSITSPDTPRILSSPQEVWHILKTCVDMNKRGPYKINFA